jgi:uncharacterized protein
MSLVETAAHASDPARLMRYASRLLDDFSRSVAGIRGVLLASVDGHPIAAVLPSHDERSTAAIVAASLGLGSRLADLSGEGALEEIVVRSASGYVVVYAVGTLGVLTVLTVQSANLALLHLRARDTIPVLDDVLRARPS